MQTNDEELMDEAVSEARLAGIATWKNPQVGAVVAKGGQILARGHTQPYGGPHAERDALSKLAPAAARDATLYVTLEPCNHFGKQPPCSHLIVERGIKRVVIAETDPHSLVTGKGIAYLRQHGVEVVTGVGERAAASVNPHYNFFYRQGRPWVTLKQATSIDYRVSAAAGKRTSITNPAVYQRVHQERAAFQAVVVGSTTAIVDNPTLLPVPCPAHAPVRVILDRRGRLANYPGLKIFRDRRAPTWVFTENPRLQKRLAGSARVFCRPDCSISVVVGILAHEGVQSLYVEGGPTIHAAFAKAGLVEELVSYLGPVMLGARGVPAFTPPRAWRLVDQKTELLGNNVRISGRKQENV